MDVDIHRINMIYDPMLDVGLYWVTGTIWLDLRIFIISCGGNQSDALYNALNIKKCFLDIQEINASVLCGKSMST